MKGGSDAIAHQRDQNHLIGGGDPLFWPMHMALRGQKPGAVQRRVEVCCDAGSEGGLRRVVTHTICPACRSYRVRLSGCSGLEKQVQT